MAHLFWGGHEIRRADWFPDLSARWPFSFEFMGGDVNTRSFAEMEKEYLGTERQFSDVLKVFRISKTIMDQISENESDQIGFEAGQNSVEVRGSDIHGLGIFARIEISPGERIGIVRFGQFRTPIGRYLNHSSRPNAEMRINESMDVEVVATMPIAEGKEILTDYFYNFWRSRV